MRAGSSFDGKHLFCEHEQVWTNLLDKKLVGHCLCDRGKDEPEPHEYEQLTLPGLEW